MFLSRVLKDQESPFGGGEGCFQLFEESFHRGHEKTGDDHVGGIK